MWHLKSNSDEFDGLHVWTLLLHATRRTHISRSPVFFFGNAALLGTSTHESFLTIARTSPWNARHDSDISCATIIDLKLWGSGYRGRFLTIERTRLEMQRMTPTSVVPLSSPWRCGAHVIEEDLTVLMSSSGHVLEFANAYLPNYIWAASSLITHFFVSNIIVTTAHNFMIHTEP